jgi:hypothetical protein
MPENGEDAAIGEKLAGDLEGIEWAGAVDVDFDVRLLVD